MYVNTFKLKVTVCTSTPHSLFDFKYNVLEYRAKITEIISLSRYRLHFILSYPVILCNKQLCTV